MDTQVLIIGGGATGTGLSRDLALRGIKSILVEQADINAGASGANHGLLHSGGRYVFKDKESARQCKDEGDILKKLAPHCIEDTGGLFVAVEGDDEKYAGDFPHYCQDTGLPVKEIDSKTARQMEPILSEKIIAAYAVEDATVDPFKLSLENMAHAQSLGSTLMRNTRVTGFNKDSKKITSVNVLNTLTGEETTIEALQVVNASGAWAGEVAAMAGASINVIYSKGTLIITSDRISQGVINRLRPPSSGDILVPGGTVSILGTTSVRLDSLEDIRPTVAEVDDMIDESLPLIPGMDATRFIRAYAGVRPLISIGTAGDDRKVSRDYTLLGHEETGLNNFITISGGKLTTYRLMAEKTGDMVCERLGINKPCLTRSTPLPQTVPCQWTEPGLSPRVWMKEHVPSDLLLCECEMVPKSAVDNIITDLKNKKSKVSLTAVGLRSRVGKGPCQGSFCGVRVAAYMYEKGYLSSENGLPDMAKFFNERWKGQQTIFWGEQLKQAELAEALHCGLFDLELMEQG